MDSESKPDFNNWIKLIILFALFYCCLFLFHKYYYEINIEYLERQKMEMIEQKSRLGVGQVITGPILNIPIDDNSDLSLVERPTIHLLPDNVTINVDNIEKRDSNKINYYSAHINLIAQYNQILKDSNLLINIKPSDYTKAKKTKLGYFTLNFSNNKFINKIDSQIIKIEGSDYDNKITLPLIKKITEKNKHGISFFSTNPNGWLINDPQITINFEITFSDTLAFGSVGRSNTIQFTGINNKSNNSDSFINRYFAGGINNDTLTFNNEGYIRNYQQSWISEKVNLEEQLLGIGIINITEVNIEKFKKDSTFFFSLSILLFLLIFFITICLLFIISKKSVDNYLNEILVSLFLFNILFAIIYLILSLFEINLNDQICFIYIIAFVVFLIYLKIKILVKKIKI